MADLPDITGLAGVTPAEWLALRDRLVAIGVDAASLAPILALSVRFPEDDRDPIRLWHLRRRGDAAALAMRLLMFGDKLTEREALVALGEPLCPLLNGGGLLQVRDGHVRCVLRLAMAGDYYVFGDNLALGGDVVMGLRETTIPLWYAIAPARPLQRALDLGCGAGTVALLLSRHVAEMVASDISPRAVAIARINVALNGVDNIDVRLGDMYESVAGEVFDLIAAHAPYVALPDGVSAVSHLHGGPHGDEVALRMVAGSAPHIAPGGHAVVQSHWPLRAREAQALNIRETVGPELDVLVLRLGTTGADDLATFWGQVRQRDAATVALVRDHYEQHGLTGTESSLSVLRRGSTTQPWTAMLEVPLESVAFVTAQRIDRLIRGCDLLHGEDAALLAARLRLPEGTTLATIEGLPGAVGTKTMLMLPPATLRKPVEVTQAALQVIGALNHAATVAESGQLLPAVREILARGVLEPVEA
jgi:SAM-dependent methyltransferase